MKQMDKNVIDYAKNLSNMLDGDGINITVSKTRVRVHSEERNSTSEEACREYEAYQKLLADAGYIVTHSVPPVKDNTSIYWWCLWAEAEKKEHDKTEGEEVE